MKKFLSLVLALVMTMSLVTISAGAKDFTDGEKINYQEAVDVMSAVKVIDGYTDGSFNPQATLSRGAAAKIICNMILGPTTASALVADAAPFKDVPADSTFAGYIAFCAKEGIISGYADGTFKPGATLTSYAYMKMLLGALGYDKSIEGYEGANWSINVAKRALNIGLDKGLSEDFNGVKPVTREEACLYAFNTLKATMVEYGAKTSVSVGGAEVVIAGSAAKEVAQGSYDNNLLSSNLQFAEKYFENLKLSKTPDDFGRPANTWKVKSTKVGTYPATPDATYSKNVALGDIYADLGMTEKDANAVVYINGEEGDSVIVKKGNEAKIGDDKTENGVYKNQNLGADGKSLVGDGSTVEVFYDSKTNDVTICVIDTFVGTVSKTVAATKAKDAYIIIDEGDKAPASFNTSDNDQFTTTEEFEDDAVVLYTYSESADAIKSVKLAESVEGALTKKTATKSFTVAGETYPFAIQLSYESGLTYNSMNTDSEYVLYLDTYGNVIYVVEKEFISTDYALVLATENTGLSPFATNRVKLLTADGVVKVFNTDKNYKTGTYAIADGTIVTYKLADDGEAALRKVNTTVNKWNPANADTDVKMILNNDDAAVLIDGNWIYANSKTVFVVRDKNGDVKVYTGIKNAPDITTSGALQGVDVSYYCKTTNLATILFVDTANATLVSNSKDITFLAYKSKSKAISDKDGDYFTYNAVINGKIVEGVKVSAQASTLANGTLDATKNVLANGASYDKYDIITNVNDFSLSSVYDVAMNYGTVKMSGDYTIGFYTDAAHTEAGIDRYTVAEDAKIYKIDDDGNIAEVSLKSIKTDTNDTALFTWKDGQITNLFVQEVPEDYKDISGSTTFAYTPVVTQNGPVLNVKANTNNNQGAEVLSGVQNWLKDNNYAVKSIVPNGASGFMITAEKNGTSYVFTTTLTTMVKLVVNGVDKYYENNTSVTLDGDYRTNLYTGDRKETPIAAGDIGGSTTFTVNYASHNGKLVECDLVKVTVNGTAVYYHVGDEIEDMTGNWFTYDNTNYYAVDGAKVTAAMAEEAITDDLYKVTVKDGTAVGTDFVEYVANGAKTSAVTTLTASTYVYDSLNDVFLAVDGDRKLGVGTDDIYVKAADRLFYKLTGATNVLTATDFSADTKGKYTYVFTVGSAAAIDFDNSDVYAKAGAEVTLNVTLKNAVVSGTDTITFKVDGSAVGTATFTSADAVGTVKTITYTMVAANNNDAITVTGANA